MRINEPITQRDVQVRRGANLLSTTDAKGRITHVNEEFVRVSGFAREELVGQPHNIVRHPDMPRLAFEEFWCRLRGGRSWLGLVKNRCKNGDHYWVKAYATPIEDENGNITQYQSIRTAPPNNQSIRRAEQVYAKLKEKEPGKGPIGLSNDRRWRPALHWKLIATHAVLSLLAFGGLVSSGVGVIPLMVVWAMLTLSVGVATVMLTSPLRRAVNQARDTIDDPLMEYVFTGSNDEFASLVMERLALQSELDAISKRLADAMVELERSMSSTGDTVAQVTADIENQSSETDQVAAATEEMSQTVQEVARHAADADEAASRVKSASDKGREAIDRSDNATRALSRRLADSRAQADQLMERASSIETVLAVIQGITEQTSLLALNASIEAARAGDAGRGFAVVADEVRALAGKTKDSTAQIRSTIEELQTAVSDVVEEISAANDEAESTQALSAQSQEALVEIQSAAEHIRGVNAQIASATEEQTNTSAEIAEKLSSISRLAGEVLQRAQNVRTDATDLSADVQRIHGLINRFASRDL